MYNSTLVSESWQSSCRERGPPTWKGGPGGSRPLHPLVYDHHDDHNDHDNHQEDNRDDHDDYYDDHDEQDHWWSPLQVLAMRNITPCTGLQSSTRGTGFRSRRGRREFKINHFQVQEGFGEGHQGGVAWISPAWGILCLQEIQVSVVCIFLTSDNNICLPWYHNWFLHQEPRGVVWLLLWTSAWQRARRKERDKKKDCSTTTTW